VKFCEILENFGKFWKILENFRKFYNLSFNSVKDLKIFAKFGLTDLKIVLNICCMFVRAMQNG
jgi:hypothetical protein